MADEREHADHFCDITLPELAIGSGDLWITARVVGNHRIREASRRYRTLHLVNPNA